MRKAVIPAMFVLCGALASSLWSTVIFPLEVCPLEIVSRSASNFGIWALRSGSKLAEEAPRSPQGIRGVLLRVLLRNAFEGLPKWGYESKPGMPFSRCFGGHTVGQSSIGFGECHMQPWRVDL